MGWTPSLGWLLLACVALVLVALWGIYDYVVGSDVVCALVADGVLLLAGLLAAVWAVLQ